MISWFEKLIRIIACYDANLRTAHNRIDELEKLVRDRTDIAVDVNYRNMNHIIVIGHYKHNDYIQTFSIPAEDIERLIEQLIQMERYANVRRIDAPPNFKFIFNRFL